MLHIGWKANKLFIDAHNFYLTLVRLAIHLKRKKKHLLVTNAENSIA